MFTDNLVKSTNKIQELNKNFDNKKVYFNKLYYEKIKKNKNNKKLAYEFKEFISDRYNSIIIKPKNIKVVGNNNKNLKYNYELSDNYLLSKINFESILLYFIFKMIKGN